MRSLLRKLHLPQTIWTVVSRDLSGCSLESIWLWIHDSTFTAAARCQCKCLFIRLSDQAVREQWALTAEGSRRAHCTYMSLFIGYSEQMSDAVIIPSAKTWAVGLSLEPCLRSQGSALAL